MSHVPFVDLHAQYLTIKSEIDAAIADVIATSAFIRGPWVDRFEREFAALHGARHCVSCGNGTDALFIALRALGAGPGDEIITTAQSWIATSETITLAGARVVFCDVDPETCTLDPTRLEALITPRTRGIVPVHLYGQAADIEPICAIAQRHGLWVLEDCAQAHLATYNGRLVGTFGIAATFSFYPGKNLGAMGDAGCVITNDDQLARQMTIFARHGGVVKGQHEIEGINSRMDGLQAAVLCAKLPHLQAWIEGRRRVAARYDSELRGVGDLVLPAVARGRNHTYHVYVVRTESRDALRQHLTNQGINTVINYPVSLPFLQAYRYLGHRPEDFPIAYANQSRVLSLPMYPELTGELQAHVIAAVKSFFQDHGVPAVSASASANH